MKYKLANSDIRENYGANLLRERGIDNIELFLNPNQSILEDWRNLSNIEMAIKIVEATYTNKKPYAIICDSDVDGATSSSILYMYLKRLNPEKEIKRFIHKGKQHGLEDTWEELIKEDWAAIFIPDAGSNDGSYVEKFNCPIVVLDHHILEETSAVPINMIIVNNQTSPNYKNKQLSGAGVVWQFCRGLDNFFLHNWAFDYIDLCALGLIGDMMSMLEYENRYIVKLGLSKIQNFFFKVLIDKQSFSMGNKVTPITIAFYIVPLINAMIRVGTYEEKERVYEAFIDGRKLVESHKRGAKGTIEQLAIESARECTNAKAHQDKQKNEIVEQLEIKIAKYDLLENKILFIRLEDEDIFPSELNGLVAMALSAKYSRPTIVARLNDEGFIRGSARCPGQTELESFKNYLSSTGLFEYTLGL